MKHRKPRTGRLNTLWAVLIGSAAVAVVLIVMLVAWKPNRTRDADRLVMYCAAGIRVPVDLIAKEYEQQCGVAIELQYGGSGELLNQLEINKFHAADLYLAADSFFTDLAVQKGLAAEVIPVAHMQPVIVVRQGNPKNIRGLTDLLKADVQVVLGNPDGPAIGRTTKERLTAVPSGETSFWEKLEKHVTAHGVFKPTVNDVARDVKLGSMDAGIVWDATVAMPMFRENLEVVASPELEGEPALVTVCVLGASPQPTAALKFARFLAARDRGLPHFAEFGFKPVEGDIWAERPEMTFFCGAVNRRAVERIIQEFQAREGVTVNTVYDGCGILTGRMKTIPDQNTQAGFPDVYMACDVYYLDNVKDWFQEAVNVSDTEIVIAVPKGSKKIVGLSDLVKPGIRVAVGEPNQCTIGALTRRLLQAENLYDQLKQKQGEPGEVVVEKTSSALLVPDVTTGHVDAAVAYLTDTLANRERVDIVRVDSQWSKAIQPFGIARSSDFKYLGRRLFQRIADSPEAFEDAGFHFLLEKKDQPPAPEKGP